jgi:hypothetical protein
MKILVVLLALMNVAYFAWAALSEPVVTQNSIPRLPEGVKRLALVTEVNEQPEEEITQIEQEAAQEVVIAKTSQDSISCYTLGPFRKEKLVQQLSARMDDEGFQPNTRAIEQTETAGYWVYLPPYKSRKEALAVAGKLAERGVKDYYVVTNDENKNAVSLGLFSEKGRADRRKADIRRYGYKPRSEIRYRDRTYYWVDYQEKGAVPLPEDLWSLIPGEKPQRLARECN